jgi:hypothetical protein
MERDAAFYPPSKGSRGLCLALLALIAVATSAVSGEGMLVEWRFDRAGDFEGWQPNAQLTNVVVTNGLLACRAVGSDPILELNSVLNLKASPWQVVEIRLKADRDGMAELFWSNTSTGRYGGFAQEKTTRFNVTGDDQWHTYRLLPGWHPEGRIVRLRFDVYDGAQFELDFIRVLQLTTPVTVSSANFDFRTGASGWQWFDSTGVNDSVVWQPGEFRSVPTGWLLSPPLDIDSTNQNYVTVRMAASLGGHATLFFFTERERGWHSFTFPIEADGREHIYNLDLLASRDWRGRVIGLGLCPSDAVGATVQLRSLAVSDAPQGPPQLKVISFALESALPRVGMSVKLAAVIENTGGQVATNLSGQLSLPEGVKLVGSSPTDHRAASVAIGEEARLSWTVQAGRPLAGQVRLKLTAANADPVSAVDSLRFTPRLEIKCAGYVPEPKPVRGPFEVGAYYFPGWQNASQWQPLQRFPERKPVLGWYREGDPQVADWHIKWAVEHGITFFAYDWYWSQGARQLEHALHDGYFKARYRHLLKFCLLWANHNPPGTSSQADCVAVTRHWIENYFRRPEHLTIDGKPVMIIFSPDRLTEDLGSAGVRQALAAMRIECERAGLKGLHLIACVSEAGGLRRAAEEGYDAVTAYTWPGLGMSGEGKFAPYGTLLAGYRRQWKQLQDESQVPLCPLPLNGGWDSRPWHGENNLVRFGRTPELFQRHVRDAKQFLETVPSPTPVRKVVLVEAWNEWGEGAYIEPHSEFGFGYLDALREVFTDATKAHDDVTPADVGLGPYGVPPPEPARTSWRFDRGNEGWDNTMQLSDVKIGEGFLQARTTGNDPAFFSPPTRATAGEFNAVVVRMRLTSADGTTFKDRAQLFWRTSRLAESESTSEHFEVQADGQWHDYRIPVGQNPRWRGVITRLRLDPGNQSNVSIDLDSVRLVR